MAMTSSGNPLMQGTRRLVATIQVKNVPNFQEATLRTVITPRIEIDQETKTVSIVSQGLTLTEEKRLEGLQAMLVEVAARYRHGEGSIKQQYRYLVFEENQHLYCQRLPMGSWAPGDPDVCFEWLGRGGLQQGDFVLLPRKKIPNDAMRIERPSGENGGLWQKVRSFIGEAFLDEEAATSEWERLIGRHDPVECEVYRKDNRLYLKAERDTEVRHPEHATLSIPAGVYEIVEDRASSYWRKAID